SQATSVQHVISKWDLERRKELLYVIDKSVPEIYHETIQQGVLAWNPAFERILGRSVLRCVKPKDEQYPEEYEPGDGRHIAIFMTNPSRKGLLGYGPSAVDYRSGEILMASVVLGLKPHVQIPSDFSEALLQPKRNGDVGDVGEGGCRLLDADDPDVLKALLETTVHEVGHTLGLRHNFIAAEDGGSSVMDYPDDLDTSNPDQPVFGGHFLGSPGRYDHYAITYGYAPLTSETRGQRHPKLDVLANGQGVDEELSAEVLLEAVRAKHVDCNMYSQRVLGTLEIASRAVLCAGAWVAGACVDASRRRAERPQGAEQMARQYVAPSARVGRAEGRGGTSESEREWMALDLLVKKNAPYIIWTVVAIVGALVFLLSLRSESKRDAKPSSRQKRVVSLCLDGLLLSPTGCAESVRAKFLSLCAGCEVYAFALAESDEAEKEKAQALAELGAFDAGLKRHRLMFSSSCSGRGSMVRQLQPQLHLETEPAVAEQLQGKVPEVRVVGASDLPSVEEVEALN
ncbi:unnamed protein product, partial [Effrenium voratum]